MSCRAWEEKSALHAGGDLEPAEVRALQRHLSDCPACSEVLAAFQASARMMQEVKAEPIDVSRVHARVMDRVRELEAKRNWFDRLILVLWGGFHWRYAVLGCIAVLVGFAGVRLLPVEISVPQVAVRVPPAPLPLITTQQVMPARLAHRRLKVKVNAHPVQAPVDAEPVQPPDTVVQLQTDNPNVVIYWLIESKGDR